MQIGMEVETATCDDEQTVFLANSGAKARAKRVSPWFCAMILCAAGVGTRVAWNQGERRMEPNDVIGRSGNDLCSDQRTISMSLGLVEVDKTKLKGQDDAITKVKEAIAGKAKIDDVNVDVDKNGISDSGSLVKVPVTISVPAGITPDAVLSNLQDGVDAAASVEDTLQTYSGGDILKTNGKKENIKAYTSALTLHPVNTAQGFESEVSVAVVMAGDGITWTDDKQKDGAHEAVKRAVASKAKVDPKQIEISVDGDAKNPTATISVPAGSKADDILTNLRDGADVAVSIKEELKAVKDIHPASISVYTSQITQPAVRQNKHKLVILKMQVHGLDLSDAQHKTEARKAMENTIKEKLQLPEKYVTVTFEDPAAKQCTVTAEIDVPGTTADVQQSTLQSTLQNGADLSDSVEKKLKALTWVTTGTEIEVYRSNLRVGDDEKEVQLILDLLVDGIDFGKVSALPTLMHKIKEGLQKAVATEAGKDDAFGLEKVELIRPCQLNSGPILYHAKIAVPTADSATMETKLKKGVEDSPVSDVAKHVQCALVTVVEDALSKDDIRVYTADKLPDKKSTYKCNGQLFALSLGVRHMSLVCTPG